MDRTKIVPGIQQVIRSDVVIRATGCAADSAFSLRIAAERLVLGIALGIMPSKRQVDESYFVCFFLFEPIEECQTFFGNNITPG